MLTIRIASAGSVTTALLAPCLLVGCALGTTKTVNGANYSLSGAEAVLADGIEATDPKSAPIEERCAYWQRERAHLNASNQTLTNRAGVISASGYDGVRAWADALQGIACAAAEEKATRKRAQEEAARAEQEEEERAAADARAEKLRPQQEERRKALEAEIAARRASAEARTAEEQKLREANDAKIREFEKTCRAGKAADCVRAAQLSDPDAAIVFLQAACDLNDKLACAQAGEAQTRRAENQARAAANREARRNQDLLDAQRAAARAEAEAERDPMNRAFSALLRECLVANGASAEGICKKALRNSPLLTRKCQEFCEGDQLDRCDTRCTAR